MNQAEPQPDGRWRLDGRVALVTGASAGLGPRFARVLHAAGAHVVVTARRADRLRALAQECGNRVETLAGDIADPLHRQHVAELVRRHGRLDVLVNNAGYNATKGALINLAAGGPQSEHHHKGPVSRISLAVTSRPAAPVHQRGYR